MTYSTVLLLIKHFCRYEHIENVKGVIRSRKQKADRQHYNVKRTKRHQLSKAHYT
jgi:hypothetical protein